MSSRITKKQHEILEYIENFSQNTGYSPTYREIMHGLGYKSVATVAKHIENLVILGRLEKNENEARSLVVKSQKANVLTEEERIAQDFLTKKRNSYIKDGRDLGASRIDTAIKTIWG